MKIFVIDAYDSFVFMLYQYLGELGAELEVKRNDQFTLSEIKKFDPDYIVLSPGPGRPEDSHFVPVIQEFEQTPILGVCLGHQAIGLAFGARVKLAEKVFHGKTALIKHDGKTIFKDLENPFEAARYHSLAVDNLPSELEASSHSLEDKEIMSVRHVKRPVEGVQFHPESVLTKSGKKLLSNFINYYR